MVTKAFGKISNTSYNTDNSKMRMKELQKHLHEMNLILMQEARKNEEFEQVSKELAAQFKCNI